jgi:hypothetical protein
MKNTEEYQLLGYNAACYLLVCWFLDEIISSALKMEAICFSEMLVDTQRTTLRYVPEVDTLHNHSCENLKLHKEYRVGSSVML